MFLKSLRILRADGIVVRDIRFHSGLNLIVDETVVVDGRETGNNVGKTTVLKLVDFCLGAKANIVYVDQDNRRNEHKIVKDFLIDAKVRIQLRLGWMPDVEDEQDVLIERNFLSRKNRIQRIDGEDKTDEEFEEALTNLLFPGHYGRKPTFRQIIAHNIRYDELSMSSTLKYLNAYTQDVEYEALYLFLFGCDFEQGNLKQELRTQMQVEENFKKRLESEQTKSAYETALIILQSEIEELEKTKQSINLNRDFEADLDRLNSLRYDINVVSSKIGRLELRRDLILEAQRDMQMRESNIDIEQLRQIYAQATSLVPAIQKTFEELCTFHNRMLESKIRFIVQDLPQIDHELSDQKSYLNRLLNTERELSSLITKTDSFSDLEQLIVRLNEKYQKKGEYENTIRQVNDVESKISEIEKSLDVIDDELFSEEFFFRIKDQVNKFNKNFSAISDVLYGEKFALKVDLKHVKGRRVYDFNTFNLNFSSGKKQGEICCFDIAYTVFADEERIPCMHFLLTDKKELMHDNQLIAIANLIRERNIQFVTSILRDKLPEELNKDEYIIIKLAQSDKLFRM